MAYKIYTTDALKAVTVNTARFNGGSEMKIRFVDLIDKKQVDTRTGDEIALDVIEKAGLSFGVKE